jgi:excisionase family DNA binding protein
MNMKQTMTEAELIKYLRVSRTTLWRLRRAGKISYYRVATKVLYSIDHVDDLLASCERVRRSKAPRLMRPAVDKAQL